MTPTDFEKLGAFYLGRVYDLDARVRKDELLMYDAKDLVTHAVCVGMTGSGKTGLCLDLLEEAAIDGIPSIVIDPKGDLGNLLLSFPELRAEDFRPWINEEDAQRKGLDPDAFAAAQAVTWKKGLADWGQDGARIARFRESVDLALYTPGSSAGLPVSVMKSFAAPGAGLADDPELFRERVATTATSLLALLGIEADPLQSREHILLSNLLHHAWSAGEDCDLGTLIRLIQTPPFSRLGVMELEAVFPAKDRFGLAMALNNLVASPGFAAWTEGEALDVAAFLRTPTGKPRISIFSIAHLAETERMFFVALLLNEVLAWVRAQSGTTSLRALLYMDEIAGYFPPVRNPPSKAPLLTLLKQARAFGLGCVLATQNPVDLDYKGLANAGTWFIGRLQTERDKARVLDGLEGAAASAAGGFDRATMDRVLSQLGARVFLMNDVHEDGPVIFETRWALSYLRGPLTRQQIRTLTESRRGGGTAAGRPGDAGRTAPALGSVHGGATAAATRAPTAGGAAGSPPAADAGRGSTPLPSARPVLPPGVPEFFVPRGRDATGAPAYVPALLGTARIAYQDTKLGIDHTVEIAMLAPIQRGPLPVDFDRAVQVAFTEADLEAMPASGASFGAVPDDATKPRSYDAWKKTFADGLFRSHTLALLHAPVLGMAAKPGESERDFRARLADRWREQRDAAIEKLRAKYAPKVYALEDRLRRAEQQVEVQRAQASQSRMSGAISIGAAVLGVLTGRKGFSMGHVGRAGSAMRGLGRSARESSDVARAEENVEVLRARLRELEAEAEADAAALGVTGDPTTAPLETLRLRPKKADIQARALVLAWIDAAEARALGLPPG